MAALVTGAVSKKLGKLHAAQVRMPIEDPPSLPLILTELEIATPMLKGGPDRLCLCSSFGRPPSFYATSK